MDTYLEHLIKQRYSKKTIILAIGLYIAATAVSVFIAIFALSSPILMQFLLPIIVALFVGAWWLAKNFNVEYEYIITNDELDVDKIIARSKRSRLVTVSVKKFEIMEKTDSEKFSKSLLDPNISVKLDASIGKNSINRYYAIFENKKGRRMLLIFNPTREMLDTIKRYNPLRVNIDD